MRNRVVHLMAFHVLIELLLGGEGMLDDNHALLGELVPHQRFPLLQLAQKVKAF